MGMIKSGYNPAYVGTTSVKVPMTEAGYIAAAGETASGTKRLQINRVAAENDLADNEEVLNFILGLVKAQYDRASNQMTVRWDTEADNLPSSI